MGSTPPRIRLFVMDVDGTLTDGTITYGADGGELKSFHARDGAGVKLLPLAGITPAIVSGRASGGTLRRASELGIDEVHQGREDKLDVVEALCRARGLSLDEVAFVGDDLTDVPAMRAAGWSAAPADAAPEARAVATLVTATGGGRGAVREAVEALLRQQGQWDETLAALGHEDAVGSPA